MDNGLVLINSRDPIERRVTKATLPYSRFSSRAKEYSRPRSNSFFKQSIGKPVKNTVRVREK